MSTVISLPALPPQSHYEVDVINRNLTKVMTSPLAARGPTRAQLLDSFNLCMHIRSSCWSWARAFCPGCVLALGRLSGYRRVTNFFWKLVDRIVKIRSSHVLLAPRVLLHSCRQSILQLTATTPVQDAILSCTTEYILSELLSELPERLLVLPSAT